jgi:menaquinone-dependent protoporphyrinogen oxidase
MVERATKVNVVYASKYGYTKGIAEFVAEMLREQGILADVQEVAAVHDLEGVDAFVVGSAVYMGHWMKEATEFVRRNRAVLASHPVWLFSTGPLGTETKDARGQDVLVAAEPKEIAEFKGSINPRDHRVFFGGLDASKLAFGDRMVRRLPAARAVLPEGDFRNWDEIAVWANIIAQGLTTRTKTTLKNGHATSSD